MEQRKTIREHLESIQDKETREKALVNYEFYWEVGNPNPKYSLSSALVAAFSWTYSPEGFDWWEEKYYQLEETGVL